MSVGEKHHHLIATHRVFKTLRAYVERSKLMQVSTTTAYLMFKKSYCGAAIRGWRKEARRRAALKKAFCVGERLQKVLAVGRWRVYLLLSKNKRRYTRRLVNTWRGRIECEKLLYRFRLRERVFRRWNKYSNERAKKKMLSEGKYGRVVTLRQRAAFEEWVRGCKAERFYFGEGRRIGLKGVIRRWRRRAEGAGRLKEKWEMFVEKEGGEAGEVLWRFFASNVALKRVEGMWNNWREASAVWVGDVRKQRLFVYFGGWRGW